MSPRAWGLAGFLLVALIAKCSACPQPKAHPKAPSPSIDRTAQLFASCLHAPRPLRKACERDYIAYAGTVASTHNR